MSNDETLLKNNAALRQSRSEGWKKTERFPHKFVDLLQINFMSLSNAWLRKLVTLKRASIAENLAGWLMICKNILISIYRLYLRQRIMSKLFQKYSYFSSSLYIS